MDKYLWKESETENPTKEMSTSWTEEQTWLQVLPTFLKEVLQYKISILNLQLHNIWTSKVSQAWMQSQCKKKQFGLCLWLSVGQHLHNIILSLHLKAQILLSYWYSSVKWYWDLLWKSAYCYSVYKSLSWPRYLDYQLRK